MPADPNETSEGRVVIRPAVTNPDRREPSPEDLVWQAGRKLIQKLRAAHNVRNARTFEIYYDEKDPNGKRRIRLERETNDRREITDTLFGRFGDPATGITVVNVTVPPRRLFDQAQMTYSGPTPEDKFSGVSAIEPAEKIVEIHLSALIKPTSATEAGQ
jgi:hypothetical protein